jgi:aspartate aminotransferase-like enzyme
MFAVREGLTMMREEGLANVIARHACVAGMIRAGIEAAGLRLFAEEGCRSNTVTAIRNPSGDAGGLRSLIGRLRTEYGLVLAGGQDALDGKIFRIGHLGAIDERDVYAILATLEQGLIDEGMLSRAGLAVGAAQTARRRERSSREPQPVA